MRVGKRRQGRLVRGVQERQAHGEFTALANPAAGRDRAAVQVHQLPHQRQADAHAALGAVERTVGLRKQIEHARQQLGCDADAVVPYPEHGFLALGLQPEENATAFIGVLGSIGQQIDHHLLQPRGIGMQPQRLLRQ